MHNEEEKEFDKDDSKYMGGVSDQSFDILK